MYSLEEIVEQIKKAGIDVDDIEALIAARDNAVRAGREINKALQDISPQSPESEEWYRGMEQRLDEIERKGDDVI